MTIPTEAATLLRDLRNLIDFAAQENVHHPDYDLAAAFEAALTKAEAVAYCDSEDPAKLANVALSHGGHGCTVPLVYAHARPPAEPVESLGRDAEPDTLSRLQDACFEAIATERRAGQFSRADVLMVLSAAAELKPAEPVASVPASAVLLWAATIIDLYDDCTCKDDYMLDANDVVKILTDLAKFADTHGVNSAVATNQEGAAP